MRYTIFDMETDGLLPSVSRIHCLSYQVWDSETDEIQKGTLTNPSAIILFLKDQECLVGHNIINYDLVVVKKLLGIEVNATIIDTLGLSWYLYPYRKATGKSHGLASWGETLGFGKPKVEDWKDQDISVYINRCESDVEINMRLFKKQIEYLNAIYDLDGPARIMGYISFKLMCLRDQRSSGIQLNEYLCSQSIMNLELLLEQKTQALSALMPKENAKVLKRKPKVMYKKDGTLSSHGKKWLQYLEENNLPEHEIVHYDAPNPGSNDQLKKWLFTLGWEPETTSISKATGLEVPQVSMPFGGGICHSVTKLYEKCPELENLEDYYVIKHRIGILKSFMNSVVDGRLYATAHGFTNTMRLQHSRPIVNLPAIYKKHAHVIRECLTVYSDEYLMCGSDLSGLEDNTKQHYIYFFDPEYVKEMRVPGFDPHLDIGVKAGIITQEEADFYKWFDSLSSSELEGVSQAIKNRFKEIKEKRHTAKTTNFSATYGAGPAKIAETAKKDFATGKKLHTVYWTRNAAVKKTANSCKVKEVFGQKWLYNPVSGFWMFLKAEKDRFSTLNQSTGVYVFDTWISHIKNANIVMQYHDEILIICKKEEKDFISETLRTAIRKTNEELQLNVYIDISIDWGTNYAECH